MVNISLFNPLQVGAKRNTRPQRHAEITLRGMQKGDMKWGQNDGEFVLYRFKDYGKE